MTHDFPAARELMVEQQVRPWDVLDRRVLDVLMEMPREQFVPERFIDVAYSDLQLPIGDGEVMLKPVVAGRALQALVPQAHEEVLEIGTGSGYVTACLAKLAREVVTIDRHQAHLDATRERLQQLGITNVRFEHADALQWRSDRRFDAICVNAAVTEIPQQFVDLLKPGGRLFIVRGRSPAMEAVLVHNDGGLRGTESLFETDIPYLHGATPAPTFHL